MLKTVKSRNTIRLILMLILNVSFVIPNYAHAAPAPAIATGQTLCYDTAGAVIACAGTGQDGDKKPGAPWSNPRFTASANGTVTDNLTGLIWLKNANCTDTVGGVTPASGLTWTNALLWSKALASGKCGLSDSSAAGQWRLPSLEELMTLPDYSQANSATWLNTQGFFSVQAGDYWSSTNYAYSTNYAWVVYIGSGATGSSFKTYYYYVWPVRGGQ